MAILIDSYSEDNSGGNSPMFAGSVNGTAGGQSFTCTSSGLKLASCKFYISREGSASGNLFAKLYSHSGTYGTSSLPNTLLATSDAVPCSSFHSLGLVSFTFSGVNKVALSSGTKYVIVIENTTSTVVNVTSDTYFGHDYPSHSGNRCSYTTSFTWVSHGSNSDLIFYVYGDAISTLTTGSASGIFSKGFTMNGNITNVYGSNATRRGFCYMSGTSGNPTTSNSVVYTDGSYGAGGYSGAITGLTPNTNYRIRPYAVNSAGTGYGDTITVKTLTGQYVLDFTETIKPKEEFNPTLVFRMGEVRLLGTYGGWYIGSNYWAGSFKKDMARYFMEGVNLKDNKIFHTIRSFFENLKLADFFAKSFNRVIQLWDDMTVRSRAERNYSLFRSWIEGVRVGEVFNRVTSNVRGFVDSLKAGDTFKTINIFLKTFVEGVRASETYKKVVSKPFKEVLKVAEDFKKKFSFVRKWVEGVALSEVHKVVKVLVKILQDSMRAMDDFFMIRGKNFKEAIGIVDNWFKQFILSIQFVEVISVEDILDNIGRLYNRVLTEVMEVSDSIVKNVTIVIRSKLKVIEGELTRILNGVLIAWNKTVKSMLEWIKQGGKREDYVRVGKKLNDWEVREKDIGLYSSNVKPLDEWNKFKKKQ